jgi:NhaA family Na+:H+ antiporter
MIEHALSHLVGAAAPRRRRSGVEAIRFVTDRFLLLPLGAAIALAWANIAGESYFRFAGALAFPVNEVGMALFLALITQEVIEALMPGGALHTWRRWGMPLAAAAGGMAGAAVVYLAFVHVKHEQVLAQAWPIACTIDIAASYYVMKLIFRRGNALPFLLLLAIATNAIGLVVMVFWKPLSEGHVVGAGLLMAALGVAALLRRRRVRRFWPYLALSGTLSWLAFFVAGVHPALALVPIVPFLPHEPRRLDLFAGPPDDDPVHHVEREWNEVAQAVVFMFGLVNAGVLLRGYDTGTWAVVVAALAGRPLGVVAAVGLGVAAGLRLPRRLGWREVIIIALATSSGFTFALFFATGLLPVGAVLQQIKFGALLTAAGAAITLAAGHVLRPGTLRR